MLFICWCSEWDRGDNGGYVIENTASEILAVVEAQAKYEDTQWFPSNFLEAYNECYNDATENKEKNPMVLCVYIALNINAWMCQAARDNSEDSKDLAEIWYSKYCWLMIDWAKDMNQQIEYYNYEL